MGIPTDESEEELSSLLERLTLRTKENIEMQVTKRLKTGGGSKFEKEPRRLKYLVNYKIVADNEKEVVAFMGIWPRCVNDHNIMGFEGINQDKCMVSKSLIDLYPPPLVCLQQTKGSENDYQESKELTDWNIFVL